MSFLRKNAKLIGLIGCLVAIIGCFLPYASVLGISVKFASDGKDGIIVVVLFIISIILMLLKKEKWSLIPSILGVAINIYDGLNVSDISTLVQLEIGFYVVLVGSFVAIVAPFLTQKDEKKWTFILEKKRKK